MHAQNMAIVKSLVSVAWADGKFDDDEHRMVGALIDAFEATPEQAKELREYASTPKTLDDIPLEDLSEDDCRVVLQHAVLLTFVDREQDETEKKFIEALVPRLGIPEAEAKSLIELSVGRSKRFLNLL
jgi:uncharacterized membrane protein YebE (DUF533 family)